MERWRQPPKIVAIEPDPDGVVTMGDRRYQNVNITLANRDEFQRLVEGYVCAQCAEPHEVPFPQFCNVCRFPMREEQMHRLGMAYKGELWVGPTMSNEDELLRMDEESERKARERK